MDEKKGEKKSKKFFILIAIIIVVLIVSAIYFINKQNSLKNQQTITLKNPMKKIVEERISKNETVTTEGVIQDGIMNFDKNFIIYILLSLGVDKLHSFPSFGNPIVELVLDNEVWSSEISGGALITRKSPNENKDLRFVLSKEEAVKALLSQDIKQFMKDSVSSGKIQIEMIAGNPELLAKGYLDLYNNLNA